MSHAEVCPVCNGRGKWATMPAEWSPTVRELKYLVKCHGCNGKGWVEVGKKKGECGPVWVIDYGQYSDDGLPMVRNYVSTCNTC